MRIDTVYKKDTSINYADFTKYVYSVALGDGYLGTHGGNSASLTIAHTESQYDYLMQKAEKLSALTDIAIYKYHKEPSKPHYKLQTKTHPIYTNVYQKLYFGRNKTLHPDLLKLTDWETIAILYMDDGSLCSNGLSSYTCRIATDNFSFADNTILANKLSEFGIVANVRERKQNGKSYWYLRIPVKSIQTLIDGIKPYMASSLLYKLNFKEA